MQEENEKELVRQAMSIIGRSRTERKQAASRVNGAKAKDTVQSEEHKAKLRDAQAARRERERQERAALGLTAAPVAKKPVGRPKTNPDVPAADKKPRGRPKTKQAAAGAAEGVASHE